MNFKRLTSTEDPLFLRAMALYKISFPVHEQRQVPSQKEIIGCNEYHFDLIYAKGEFAGVILYWETEHFLYVEHFCINPEMRGRKYGQQALEELKKKKKTVILEIDPPADDISMRRKMFYKRCGFKENAFKHVHPPYHKENRGHELIIMSCPDVLTPADYEEFNSYLKNIVMGALLC